MKLTYLYTFIAPRYPGRRKQGISTQPKLRRAQIANELGCKVYGVWVPMLFTRRFEQALHYMNRPLKAKMPDHAGKEEWSWILNIWAMIICSIGCWYFDLETSTTAILMLVTLIFPIPFDSIICVLLYFFVQVYILYLIWPYFAQAVNFVLSCLTLNF